MFLFRLFLAKLYKTSTINTDFQVDDDARRKSY